jgi:hypothetical protein
MSNTQLPIAINVAPYDEQVTDRLENVPGARMTLGTAEMAWYDRVRSLGYGTKSVRAFTHAFGPPIVQKQYEDLMSVWTFQRGDIIAWALVSPRGVYWEGPLNAEGGRGRGPEAVALAIEAMEASLVTLAARPTGPSR